jgi:LCP family protein required for cell wall assembly
VNRQIGPSNSSQDESKQPEQQSPSDSWSHMGAGIPPNGLPGQSQVVPFPPVTQRPAGKGLLSNYRTSQMLQPIDGANQRPTSPTWLVEQDTLKQPAVQRPITNPAYLQELSWGQVSPHQSGITPFSTMSDSAQSVPTYSPMPVPGTTPTSTGSQPLQPLPVYPQSPMPGTFGQYDFQPARSVSISGQQQGGWQGQPMGYNYNGPGGALPFVQGPQGGGQKNGWRKKKRRFPIWARVAVAILTIFIILGGTGFYYYEANFAAPVNNIVGQTAPLLKGEGNPNVTHGNNNDILSGGRINILLLGSDTDQKFQDGYLAQTDIVVTIDPATKSVGMLSIPRDLFVNVPGYGMMKLDEAFYYGDKYNNHDGVGLSRLTISQDFGIPINYYAWVGLNGFIKVVDTAGGVDIDVTHPITDDIYPDDTVNSKDAYAYKRLYLAPGPQHLDGPTALEYVRSRHADLVGDFGRSARQQQVLSSLKTKLVNSSIIDKLPELAKDMNGYLKTDMQILDIIKLMNFARTIDLSKIQRVILSPPTYSVAAIASTGHDTGEAIFHPNCGSIQQVIARMFALGSKARCNVQANNNTNTPVLAQTTQPSGPAAPATTNSWQAASRLASMSLHGTSTDDPFGMRSLLDVLLLVVFESPAALQL